VNGGSRLISLGINERVEVTQTTTVNVIVRLHDGWWTPSIARGPLPGVDRGRFVATGVVGEKVITTEMLEAAQSVKVVSSLRGPRVAELVDDVFP
jgi:para-aminobenzoate synthetase/4-amino-4-deoxychorismate lyase